MKTVVRRHFLRMAGATAIIQALPKVAQAQTYPAKTTTIIVPAAPGGVTDLLGRALAKHFAEVWGQQVVVENKPGANNQIAAEYVAKAPDRRKAWEDLLWVILRSKEFIYRH